jgi:Asp-tRNA(Asn)/Glu-tRNA(Gln) amidotransferase A subunit family amidase
MNNNPTKLASNGPVDSSAVYCKDATELATLIRTKKLSSREVVQAHLDRIAAVNPKINATSEMTHLGNCLYWANSIATWV